MQIAKVESQCPSAKQGGDLGYLRRGESIYEIDDVLFTKEVKKVHKLQSPAGWHLLYISERITEEDLKAREESAEETTWIHTCIEYYHASIPFIGPLIIMFIIWMGSQSLGLFGSNANTSDAIAKKAQ